MTLTKLEELEESEKKYRVLVEMTGTGFLIVDAKGKVLDANAEYLRFTDRKTLAEVVGHHVSEWTTPYDVERSATEIKKSLKLGFIRNLEIDHINQQGEIITIEINATVIGSGKTLQIMALSHDITKHKQTEESLRKSKVQLDEAMRIAQLGAWEYDVALDEFTFNDLFYLIFRTTAKKEGGYKMSSASYAKRFIHPDDRVMLGEETKKSLDSDDPNYYSHVDHRVIRADGTTGYFTVHIRIIKDSQNKTIKTYGVNQDISERKELQQKLNIKIEELEKINKFMVDRELKMVKLKEEIAALKK